MFVAEYTNIMLGNITRQIPRALLEQTLRPATVRGGRSLVSLPPRDLGDTFSSGAPESSGLTYDLSSIAQHSGQLEQIAHHTVPPFRPDAIKPNNVADKKPSRESSRLEIRGIFSGRSPVGAEQQTKRGILGGAPSTPSTPRIDRSKSASGNPIQYHIGKAADEYTHDADPANDPTQVSASQFRQAYIGELRSREAAIADMRQAPVKDANPQPTILQSVSAAPQKTVRVNPDAKPRLPDFQSSNAQQWHTPFNEDMLRSELLFKLKNGVHTQARSAEESAPSEILKEVAKSGGFSKAAERAEHAETADTEPSVWELNLAKSIVKNSLLATPMKLPNWQFSSLNAGITV